MASTPTPDPYSILGVPKDATLAAIRSAHRKLVLQTHPDKIQDESLRAVKQDEFQRIQQAYEILSDEARRREYDEQASVPQDKGEYFRDGVFRYEVRPAAPSRESERMYAERKAARLDEEDMGYFRYPYEEVSPKVNDMFDRADRRRPARTNSDYRKPTRSAAEDDYDAVRLNRDSQRQRNRDNQSERSRMRDRERRRGYDEKYSPRVDNYSDEDDDDDEDTEVQPRVPVEGERTRKKGPDVRRNEETPRREPFRRRLSDDDTYRKLSTAREYMEVRSRLHRSPTSTAAYYDVTSEYRSPSPPPIVVEVEDTARRSSARRSSDRDRDRGSRRSKSSRKDSLREHIEIVEPDAYESPRPSRPVPSIPHSVSSPSTIRIPSAAPKPSTHQRSATLQSYKEVRPDPPSFSRSSTMPTLERHPPPSSSSRKRDNYTAGSSKLKTSVTEIDSGYSSPGTPDTPLAAPGRSPTRHASEEIRIEDAEPRYSSHSSRHRKVSVEPDDYVRPERSVSPPGRGSRHRKVSVEPADYDRRERSLSPHGPGRRQPEEPSSTKTATPIRPSLARGSSTASTRLSPSRTTSTSYVYSVGKESTGSPAFSRREASSATSSRISSRTVEPSGGSGGSSSRQKLFGEVQISKRDIQYSPRITRDSIRYSDSRAHEAVYRDAAPPRSRSHFVRGPHPGLARAETSM